MFWRILWRLLYASKARLAVAFLAVTSGAAVCAALLNLQMDAKQKLTREFRAFGANVIVAPARALEASEPALLDASVAGRIERLASERSVAAVPFLYVTARAQRTEAAQSANAPGTAVIIAGTRLGGLQQIAPGWRIQSASASDARTQPPCFVGVKAAERLAAKLGGALELRFRERKQLLHVAAIVSAGGAEDSQVFVGLPLAQELSEQQGKISLVQLSVPGTALEIERFAAQLSSLAPGAEVRLVRALAEAEGRLLGKIQGLILATVILILVLTALCVLATMAALAMERRRDVGLMKALGGSMRRVMRLFLLEAGSLGLAGGLLGTIGGMLLSRWMGERVFGMPVTPRFAVLPIILAMMTGVSVAAALPLRLLARVKPAVIFRGEG